MTQKNIVLYRSICCLTNNACHHVNLSVGWSTHDSHHAPVVSEKALEENQHKHIHTHTQKERWLTSTRTRQNDSFQKRYFNPAFLLRLKLSHCVQHDSVALLKRWTIKCGNQFYNVLNNPVESYELTLHIPRRIDANDPTKRPRKWWKRLAWDEQVFDALYACIHQFFPMHVLCEPFKQANRCEKFQKIFKTFSQLF